MLPLASAVKVIEPVPSVCVSVCASVSALTATNLKFYIEMNLDNIFGEFDGQGHRSKVKVTSLENVIFIYSNAEKDVKLNYGLEYDVM